MLKFWKRVKRLLVGPAYGKHSKLAERARQRRSREEDFWGTLPSDDGRWLEEEKGEDPYALRETRQQYYESYRIPPFIPEQRKGVTDGRNHSPLYR